MPPPRFDRVPEPERELTFKVGALAKIIQLAADLSYAEGQREASDSKSTAKILEVLSLVYEGASDNTSYGKGQRYVIRRVAELLDVRLTASGLKP